jgi:hypothetical protein
MKTIEEKVKTLVEITTTELLVKKLIETLKDRRLMTLNIAIQQELEKRIGEDKLDLIIDANR